MYKYCPRYLFWAVFMSFLAYYGFMKAVKSEVIHNILGRTWIQPKITTEGINSILYHLIQMRIDIMVSTGLKILWQLSSSSLVSAGRRTASWQVTYITCQWKVAAIVRRVNNAPRLTKLNRYLWHLQTNCIFYFHTRNITPKRKNGLLIDLVI